MRSITRYMTFKIHHDSRPHPEEVQGDLSYRSTDPYAVQASFPSQVVWVWSRDLLLDAFAGAVGGEGDISMAPFPFHRHPDQPVDRILISINTPDGRAKISVDAERLAGFLADTARIVAPGTEAERYDLDAELRALTEQAT